MRKFIIGLLALVVVAGAAFLYGRWLFYGSAVDWEHHLYIYRSTDYAAVADSVRRIVRHPKAFDLYARRLDLESTQNAVTPAGSDSDRGDDRFQK